MMTNKEEEEVEVEAKETVKVAKEEERGEGDGIGGAGKDPLQPNGKRMDDCAERETFSGREWVGVEAPEGHFQLPQQRFALKQ